MDITNIYGQGTSMLCTNCKKENSSGSRFCNTCGAALGVFSELHQPNSAHSPRTNNSDFIGRERELAQLKADLEEAMSGRGQLLMLAGEAGIGKTRTAQELASYAEAQGARAFWGRCYEEEGTPPYWPWVWCA